MFVLKRRSSFQACFLCLTMFGVLFSYFGPCLLVCARVTRADAPQFEGVADQAFEEYEQQEQGQEGKSCP